MAIFVGLLADGTSLDVPLIGRYGVADLDDPDTPTSAKNAKFRDALATACDTWQRHTGREYGTTTEAARTTRKYEFNPLLDLPDPAQSVSAVEKFSDAEGWCPVADSEWTPEKIGTGRGDIDALRRPGSWDPGRYRITAIWGEAAAPEFVRFHAIKLATHLWKMSDNISGFGAVLMMGDGAELPQDRVPWQIWDAMNRDRRAAFAFRKRR